MLLEKEYFDIWMRRIMERLEAIEQRQKPPKAQEYPTLENGEKLFGQLRPVPDVARKQAHAATLPLEVRPKVPDAEPEGFLQGIGRAGVHPRQFRYVRPAP